MGNIRDHLQSIWDTNKILTPRLVVDTARPKSHPLHSHFEWDDSIAGEKYREHQASELIRSVRISYKNGNDTEQEIRYFVSIKESEGYAYHPAEVVAADEKLTAIVLREMEREWKQLHARYNHFQEFTDLIQRTMAETMKGRRKKAA